MNTKNTRRIEMLANGPVGSTLFKLSAPAIAGMVVMAVYNIVDTFFVSLLRDTAAIAATGIVFPMFQLIGAVGLTFGIGAASMISRRLGENNYQAANEVGATALYSAVTVGIVFSITGAALIQPILLGFGATETILNAAKMYGRIIIGGSVFQVVNMTANNLLRAEGASMYSSMGQMIGAVLNIILDPIFIFALDMGVTGAAVATVIAQCISTIWLLTFYFRKQGTINPISIKNVRLKLSTYKDMMNLGFPTFLRQVLGSASFGFLNNAASVYGDPAIAAISVTFRLLMLLLMALIGLAQGLQPLAGYNYGAKNFDRVRSTLRIVFITAVSLGLAAGTAAFVFAPGIMRLFAPQDEQVIAMGTQAMRLVSLGIIPIAMVIIFGGIFQALGDGKSALVLAAGQQGLFLIPLIFVLPRLIGLAGVFASQPAGFFLTFLVGLVLFQRTMRKIREEEESLTGKSEPVV
ncbi:MAG: MATE family efflux transporter [Spirochaetia bacterium]